MNRAVLSRAERDFARTMAVVTWEGIRGTALWMLFLLIAGVAAGGWYVQHSWSQLDAYIDTAVETKLAEILPGWRVDYKRIAFDPAGFLTLSDLALTPKEGDQAAIRIPRIQFELDSTVLAQRRVVVKKVTIDHPELRLIRDPNGEWNWKQFTGPQPSTNGSPEWKITDGRVVVLLYSPDSNAPRELVIERVELTGIPEAARRHLILGECQANGIGRLALQGHFDPPRGNWELTGHVTDVRVSSQLLNLTSEFSPAASEKLAKAFPTLSDPRLATSPSAPMRYASNIDATANPGLIGLHNSEPEDPIAGEIAANFRIGQHRPQSPLDYELNAEITNGRISESVIPIPLYDLNARLRITPLQMVVERLSAANGSVKLFVDGGSLLNQGSWNHKYLVKATSLRLDERMRPYLPEAIGKVYDSLRPSGTFDLDVDLEHSGGRIQQIVLRRFHAIDCRILPSLFAYQVASIDGEIVQQAETFLISMRGMAGDRPVTLSGSVTPGGAAAIVNLDINAEDIPLDDQFLNAFQLPNLQGTRHALESLQASGLASSNVKIFKRQHEDSGIRFAVSMRVHDASMTFRSFPYPLNDVSGEVIFNPLERNAWRFENFRGKRGNTVVTGNGYFDLDHPPGILAIRCGVVGLPIDHELHAATTTANPMLKEVWDHYGLSGNIDIDQVSVAWSAGLSPVLALDGIQWRNGTLEPSVLPYRWENVVGAMKWRNNRLTVHSLQGWHGETYLHIDGSNNDEAAYLEFPKAEELRWQMHVGDLKLVKLYPDQSFRRALPSSIAAVLDALDPQGRVDLQSGIDLRAWNNLDETITAHWNMNLFLDGNSLMAGLELTDVTGKVEVLNGEWDGHRNDIDAAIDLTSLRTLGLPFTRIRAPLRVSGQRIVVGTPTFSEVPPLPAGYASDHPNPSSGKQLTANIYGGAFGVDAEIRLHPTDPEQVQYRAELKMADVEINEWAKDQKVSGQERLRGMANGEIHLSGKGTSPTATLGSGWLDATPAELYELPVMAQMLALLRFRPPDDTAFNYGYCDFTIHDGIFDFSRIKLIGEVLTLAGKGFIGYAGSRQSAVNLDFYSQAENQFRLFQPVVDLLSNKWIRIQVLGTVDAPVPVVQPQIGPLDTVLGGLLRSPDAPQRRLPEIPGGPRPTSARN